MRAQRQNAGHEMTDLWSLRHASVSSYPVLPP